MLVDITASNCCLESGLNNAEVAHIFADHPTFSIHIDDDVAEFRDGGRLFFACSYHKYYRNEDYIRIEDPITINLCVPTETMVSHGTLLRGVEVTRSWKDETLKK